VLIVKTRGQASGVGDCFVRSCPPGRTPVRHLRPRNDI
jgi:hypothetical protein